MPYEYIKLHRQFFTGTMHGEASYTKVLFLGMLLECTDGVIVATPDYLSRFSGLKLEAVEKGLERLMAPDPNSTSPEYEGRRVLEVPGARNTYKIVNFAKYQPALSSEATPRPKLDPGVPRDHPDYNRLYQKLYRKWVRDQRLASIEASRALEDEVASLEQNVNSVNSVNKEKEIKESKPPKPPKQKVPSRKAIAARGTSKHEAAWREFDAAYPRRPDGRSIARAEGRQIFEMLLDEGEDARAIIDGCVRYNRWLIRRSQERYIKMMPSWLNGRRWEESYEIREDSEEGRIIAAREARELENLRRQHEKTYTPVYENWLKDQAAEQYESDESFRNEFNCQFDLLIEKRARMGAANFVRILEQARQDPEKLAPHILEFWKLKFSELFPSFWTWDQELNPDRFHQPS